MKKYIFLLIITSPLLASSGHGFNLQVFLANIFSFSVLIALFIIFARKPLKNFLKSRKETLKTNLEKSEIEKKNLEKDLASIRDKYSNMDKEEEHLRNNSAKRIEERIGEMNQENDKILNKMDNDLELQENNIVKNSIDELQEEVKEKAIAMAEEKIKRLLEEDKLLEVRLLKQFKI